MNRRFEHLAEDDLRGVNLLIGGEICFWDDMVDPLAGLIERALDAGVDMIVIADPGRTPFDALEADCLATYNVRAIQWRIRRPYDLGGRILKIGAMNRGGRETTPKPPASSSKNGCFPIQNP
jgi:hypothetical protein